MCADHEEAVVIVKEITTSEVTPARLQTQSEYASACDVRSVQRGSDPREQGSILSRTRQCKQHACGTDVEGMQDVRLSDSRRLSVLWPVWKSLGCLEKLPVKLKPQFPSLGCWGGQGHRRSARRAPGVPCLWLREKLCIQLTAELG